MSKFLLHLFAAFAEMERGIIRERVCAGVRAAKAKGTRWGVHSAYSGALSATFTGAGHELAGNSAGAGNPDVHGH